MRKSYVTIEEMGTERQNAGYTPPVFVPRSPEGYALGSAKTDSHMYGRTSISDIEKVQAVPAAEPRKESSQQESARTHTQRVDEAARRPVVADAIRCTDVSEHVRNCMVCSRLYHQDLMMYSMIIGVLAIIVAMLLLRR